ncbi:pum [Symbiodinium necroappetens]|uniref:Pum protein n=1 Tax=Symbiodinium necroappetens TaxID=1628268 RepID=A0A812V6M2_9DINO|nr:pum [Symbiodinium necroappetens]
MFTGDEGQRKGHGRGQRNQRKNQTPHAQSGPAAGWAPPPHQALPPDLGAFGGYPNPYAGMPLPYTPGPPPPAGYNAYIPYPPQPYTMMPPPNMYPGMPAMPMFPGMPPADSCIIKECRDPSDGSDAQTSIHLRERGIARLEAKSRNKPQEAAGGGEARARLRRLSLEPLNVLNAPPPRVVLQEERTSGRRKARGGLRWKEALHLYSSHERIANQGTDEPSAAIEDDANLSLLLNQVRRRQRDVSLEEVLSEKLVVEFAKDQHGSRFLQTKLDEAPDDVKRMVYAAIQEDAAELSKEVFANHVAGILSEFVRQKKAGACRTPLRADPVLTIPSVALVRALADNVATLSQDQYGCRVIQKAIQAVSKESQQQIARELEDHVESCIRYGCRVIQRLLEHCVSAQLEPMLEKILVNVAVLAKVVQHMLEHGRKEDKKRIIETIRANIADFSKEKFSSNVVEKCFEAATVGENADDPLIQQERNLLMRMVLERPEVIYAMCTNTYGNYVAFPWSLQPAAMAFKVRLLLGARRLVLQPPRFSKGASTVASAPKAPSSGSGMAAYILRTGLRGMRGACTVTGGVGLTVFGLVICPYVSSRSPIGQEERASLEQDLLGIVAFDSSRELLTASELFAAVREMRMPPVSFHDLQRPSFFLLFEWVGRFTFACYSDASGVMTLDEFKCAVHKMIDLVLEAHSLSRGKAAAPAEARAQAVRELTKHVVPAVFRVLDFDQNGSIGAFEFIRGALLLLATVQGAPLDTPQLADLAFRVVDADGDGLVTSAELLRWVTLALEHGVTSADVLREPRGPFGWFGTRILTPAQLAKRWLAEADFDRDGKLLPQEFAVLAPRLRIHQTIGRMVQKMLENTRGEEWPALWGVQPVAERLGKSPMRDFCAEDENVGRKFHAAFASKQRQGRSSDVRRGTVVKSLDQQQKARMTQALTLAFESLRAVDPQVFALGLPAGVQTLQREAGGHFGKGAAIRDFVLLGEVMYAGQMPLRNGAQRTSAIHVSISQHVNRQSLRASPQKEHLGSTT